METLNGSLYISPKNLNSIFTAKDREKVSFPTRLLFQNKKIKGRILDFGCGLGKDVEYLKSKSFNVSGFDPNYTKEKPFGKYDVIICNYVLNVLFSREQLSVILTISELLKKSGIAYYTVRRDLKQEGFRRHYVHKKLTFQTNVTLPFKTYFKNDFCEIYEYKHINQYNYDNRRCPFCKPTNRWELITESPYVFAVYDLFPKSKGHSLIIPKSHVVDYFFLSEEIKKECWIVVDRVKNIIDDRFKPSGYNIKINIGKSADQKISHTAIHLLPRY